MRFHLDDTLAPAGSIRTPGVQLGLRGNVGYSIDGASITLQAEQNLLEPGQICRVGTGTSQCFALAVLQINILADARPRRAGGQRIRERSEELSLLLPANSQSVILPVTILFSILVLLDVTRLFRIIVVVELIYVAFCFRNGLFTTSRRLRITFFDICSLLLSPRSVDRSSAPNIAVSTTCHT